jgi:glutathione reductase (NADPH)
LLLARVDQEIVDQLIENMKKHKVDVRLMTSTKKVAKDSKSGMLNVHLDNGTILETESCLLALGRLPNTSGMNLSEVGIELEKNGAVKVDDY